LATIFKHAVMRLLVIYFRSKNPLEIFEKSITDVFPMITCFEQLYFLTIKQRVLEHVLTTDRTFNWRGNSRTLVVWVQHADSVWVS